MPALTIGIAQQQYSLAFMVVGGQVQACAASLLSSATGCTRVTQRHTSVTYLVPPLRPPTMTRLSLVALLALAFSGVACAAPPASQEIVAVDDVHTKTSWSYEDCGMWLFASEKQRTRPNGVM